MVMRNTYLVRKKNLLLILLIFKKESILVDHLIHLEKFSLSNFY